MEIIKLPYISVGAGDENQILMDYGVVDETCVKIDQVIEQICKTQELLRNVDMSLLATMEGKEAEAFSALSDENHATIKSVIEKTKAVNQEVSASNKKLELTDLAIAGNMGGEL